MPEPRPDIYTVGHSNHSGDYFLELLQVHGVNCLVDVRSTAASRFNPQFNQKRLADFLHRQGISYLHFDRAFGARRTEPELLDETGRVDFAKVRQTEDFLSGVERLKTGLAKGFTIALMCAEADPLTCHRFGMISGYLAAQGWQVGHILKDKSLIDNAVLEEQLLRKYRREIDELVFFEPGADRLALAYRLLNGEIGYVPKG